MVRLLTTIEFLSTDEGGRTSALPLGRIGYIIEVGGQNFGCWLINTGSEVIVPGGRFRIELVLAEPELALPHLQTGSSFVLKDYRRVGRGIVDEVYS